MGTKQSLDENLLCDAPLIAKERNYKDSSLDSKGRKLLEFFELIGGVIVNGRVCGDEHGEYTFLSSLGRSTIDYSVASFNVLKHIQKFSIPGKHFSDHMPLVLELGLNNSNNTNTLSLPPKLKWVSSLQSKYCDALRDFAHLEYLHLPSSIESKLNIMQSKVLTAANSQCVTVPTFTRKNGWYDRECELARKQMLNFLNLSRKYNLCTFRIKYVASRKKYYNLCRLKKQLALEKNIERLNNVRDSRDWWQLANSLRNVQLKLGSNLQIEDLRQHFNSLLNDEASLCEIQWSIPNFTNIFLDAPFEMHELMLVLENCKCNKSPGLDRITYEFYKYAPQEFLVEVLTLFNVIFLKEEIPSSFKSSIILPLLKKGDPNNPENYRGLSLLDTLYKIFMGILRNRIELWAEENNIFNECQAGFRRGYSTTDNLFILSSVVKLRFKKNKKLFAFFVDFACAFDKLPRNAPFFNLSALGLSKKVITILMLLYSGTLSQVWDGSTLSSQFEVTNGVKQGCILSPTLFNLYLSAALSREGGNPPGPGILHGGPALKYGPGAEK